MSSTEACGGLSIQLCRSMGGDHRRSMGSECITQRVRTHIRKLSPNSHPGMACSRVSDVTGEISSSPGTRGFHAGEGSDRVGPGPGLAGLLLQRLLSTKEERNLSAGHKSTGSEPDPSQPILQDGDNRRSELRYPTGRLGYITRPIGCVLPRSDCPSLQEVPEICHQRKCLPIQGTSVRLDHGTSGIHQDATTTGGSHAFTRNSVSQILGRPPNKVPVQTTVFAVDAVPTRPTLQVGPGSKSRKIRYDSLARLYVHRRSVSDPAGNNVTTRGQDNQNPNSGPTYDQRPGGPGVALAITDRPVGISREAGSAWKASHSADPDLPTASVRYGNGHPSKESQTGSGIRGLTSLVDRRRQPDSGPTSGSVCSPDHSLHGFELDQLGRSCGRLSGFRSMDGEGVTNVDKLSRASSRHSCISSQSPLVAEQERDGCDRQFNCSSLCQQSGRHQIVDTSGDNSGVILSDSQSERHDQSSSHPRQTQSHSRPVITSQPNREHRVDHVSTRIDSSLEIVGQASPGSDGHSADNTVANLREPIPRPTSLRGRRNVLVMGRNGRVHISSMGHDRGSADQSRDSQLHFDSNHAQVAQQSVVSTSVGPTRRLPSPVTTQPRHNPHAPQWQAPRTNPFSGSTRLSLVAQRAHDQGFSDQVSKRLATGQLRTSTQNIYESKWRKFVVWCNQRGYNPLQLPLARVCDFFLYLFKEEKLSPVTIEGYRSAINSVWLIDGRSLSSTYHVEQLLKSFKADRPRSIVRFPKWDLNLILRTLSRPPYHPYDMENPIFLSSKTVFLLLLASARRRGDIHAIDPKRITYTRTGVILEPSPNYLPKVRSTAEGELRYTPIVIRSLNQMTDDRDELALCPVQAIKTYDAYARRRAPNRRQFFISTRTDGNPVVKNTLSSWVVKLLRRSYENAGPEDTALAATSTHEVRALAASLALQATYSLADILSAATWATPSTFASYYLRDVSGLQGRLHVTGPCIVAGKLID